LGLVELGLMHFRNSNLAISTMAKHLNNIGVNEVEVCNSYSEE
jgi:hypothetical protein